MKKIKFMLGMMMLLVSLGQAKDYDLIISIMERDFLEENLPNCIGVKSFGDKIYCAHKIYSKLDDKLNKTYSSVRKELTTSQKKALLKVQRNWVSNKDEECNTIKNGGVVSDLACLKRKTFQSLIVLEVMQNHPENFDSLLEEYKFLINR